MSENTEVRPAPVRAEERIDGLDAVRGFALLGILLMNICSFGMPQAAEGNPMVHGGATGPNYWIWWVQYVFWSGKMRALFSMCFGAGVIYLTSRAEARGVSAGDVYYRRTFWLMAFGIVHGYCIWYGDILYPYALMGLFLYPIRSLRPVILIGAGTLMLAALTAQSFFWVKDLHEARAKHQAIPQHAKLSAADDGVRGTYEGFTKEWMPSKDKLAEELRIYREGSYVEAFGHRASTVQGWTSQTYYSPGWWDALGMMLIGMGLAKLGVFAGVWSVRRYFTAGALSLTAGAIIGAIAANHEGASNFDPFAAAEGYKAYQPVRFLVAFGYLCLLTGVVKARLFAFVMHSLAATGRMAFSNYILHSLLSTAFFYSFGFAMFGKLERYQLYYAVLAIWLLQLAVSPIWLRHFQYGPLEWCWRSLTYWKRQPMRLISERSLPEEHPA